MKLFLYVKLLVLIFINGLLFAASLGGTVIIDNNDHVFNFNGKTLIIEDAGNTFGSVTVTSTGSFVFPNTVNDSKIHAYSIKLTQLPDNQFICTINQTSGSVYIHDKTDLVVSCQGKYYVSVNVSGLFNGDTYTLTDDNNNTLSINSSSTQIFPQWFYANFTYSFKPTFNYTALNYKRCSNISNGTITNNFTIYIICNTSTFNKVVLKLPVRAKPVSWQDNSGNTYMFGGWDGSIYYNDLWKFDGTNWSQVIANGATGSPSGRLEAVAWTDKNGNAYVFGGYSGGTYYNDLWKFNGSWSQVIANGATGSPSGRNMAVAWTDNAGNAYVLGGWDGYLLNDLWKFNGSWSLVSNATPINSRYLAVAWTDKAGNAYVFGGRLQINDLWKFDGTSWSLVIANGATGSPSGRYGAVAWTDNAGNAYMFGGGNGGICYNDLWKFNGIVWSQVIANDSVGSPNARYGAVSWTDNTGNAYIFGGYANLAIFDDLWKINNGTTWTQLNNVLNAPSARIDRISWKDKSGNVYVFGGYDGSTYYNDLWKFNGLIWSQVIANDKVGSPNARYGAVSWTDNAGNAYVFGGNNGGIYYNDLWKFNGTWSQEIVNGKVGSPNARYGAVAWTDNAGNTYVFGGYNGGNYYNDLWKFNGTWSQVSNVGTPPSGRYGAVAWTDNAGNAYVFGGYDGSYINDLWKFNGSWSQVSNGIGIPLSGRYGAVAWTDNAGNAYVFGGYNGSTYLNDLWKFNRSWSQVTNGIGTPLSGRYGAVAWTDIHGNAYVFGGNNGFSYLNDLYVI